MPIPRDFSDQNVRVTDPAANWRPQPRRTVIDVIDHLRMWQKYFGWRRALTAAVVISVLLVVGLWLIRSPEPPVDQQLPIAVAPTLSIAPSQVTVHVVGAVRKPGVYRVAEGSRLFEVVYVAGGFSAEADQAGINLAAEVVDGEQVYVPMHGETAPPNNAHPVVDSRDSKVHINRATAAELEVLPGIGPTTAAAIVAYREAHGSFSAVEDLLRVTGIGDAKLDAIRELISL